MQDLNDLYYFARVVEHGGFAPAGRALGVPKSTLSRRVALLEERLGSRLLQRSTRHFAMTEVGEVYYRHCVAMIAEAEAAQEADRQHPCRAARHDTRDLSGLAHVESRLHRSCPAISSPIRRCACSFQQRIVAST